MTSSREATQGKKAEMSQTEATVVRTWARGGKPNFDFWRAATEAH